MTILKLLLAFLLLTLTNCDKLNIHIVPHTHDDAGWIFTLDEYYYGKNDMNKCVKCILDSIIPSLENNEKRKFTYVEMIFFERWYKNDIDNGRRSKIQEFVKSGRLEFINGGWVMNDEATPHYQDLIDNMRMGMQFIKEEFGEQFVPKVAWYIDPFGHSMTNVKDLITLGKCVSGAWF
jgi:lysosomal alpha-mannosidase